jgi:hypothetical protein
MAYLASALKKLPASSAEQFKVVFVTTDPIRDTPKALRAWLDHFDKNFIGLTGSEAEVEAAQVAAKISPAVKTVSASGAADFGHAAFVIAYTKDNLGHVIYPSGITQEDWAHDLCLSSLRRIGLPAERAALRYRPFVGRAISAKPGDAGNALTEEELVDVVASGSDGEHCTELCFPILKGSSSFFQVHEDRRPERYGLRRKPGCTRRL